ncbi:AAA family ATPase [Pseudoglutamicibacter albus]|uniref:HelD family protein n=1 Tax=Pseudoglutamicibacter TaxID=1742991 RepID=UPI000C77D468|nr:MULTISPECIES: AAA family ATPase [Pseudoglutamicibacter]PKY79856.1 AAA family ATPase [Pseudoglutamicibacter albus]WIK84664.1 AAA family ATPase [Pseudoglutamicibacter albus]
MQEPRSDEAEQQYVSRLYARVDQLRAEKVEQLRQIQSTGAIGSVQNASERDSFAALYEDRISQLDAVEHRLVFGRIDRSQDIEWRDREPVIDQDKARYIGRIGLTGEDQQRLLIDWRAPEASTFYQATPFEPLGVARRRHLSLKGRTVAAFEDDVLDPDLATAAGASHSDGALIAALNAPRTGKMGDIVATIQAEQDTIIRAPMRGVTVVQGGPGTGKTAVALHRAAYLLYEQRERLGRAGVLIVGPSRTFMSYIERVLPSLGETGVVMSTVSTLFPGVEGVPESNRRAAYLKGSLQMADVIKRAVAQRQRTIPGKRKLTIEGLTLTLKPKVIKRALAAARASRQPHNQAREIFVDHAVEQILELYQEAVKSDGVQGSEQEVAALERDVRASRDVRVALNLCWMPLTPQQLVGELFSKPEILDAVLPRLSDASREALLREPGAPFTDADVPLLDEAAELLGPLPAASSEQRAEKAQRERDAENAKKALENVNAELEELGVDGVVDENMLLEFNAHRATGLSAVERAQRDREWTYGHVIVDEAQELTAMQWRVLMRRGPLKSFTIVGDIAQATTVGSASSWAEALEPHLGERYRLEELTVNYRTPRQVVELAEKLARSEGLPISAAEAVRDAETDPAILELTDSAEVLTHAADAVARFLEQTSQGLIAVICPQAQQGEVSDALSQRFGDQVGTGAGDAAAGQRIVVLSTDQAKGLEFDAVVVVEPNAIVAEDHTAAGLYVAMTRTTQDLVVLATEGGLPAALQTEQQ